MQPVQPTAPDEALAGPAAPPSPTHTAMPPIAAWWHTAGLLLILTGTTWFGHHRVAETSIPHAARAPRYLSSIALEFLLLAYVFAGIRQRAVFLRTAFRNRARTWAQSLGIGLVAYVLGFVSVAVVALALFATHMPLHRNTDVVLALLPHTPAQFALWFGVSFSAGLCEELIFRGYLQQQFSAWFARPVLAILVGALLFGSVHLYEGAGAILPLTALAITYGFIVRALGGDLRAVIVAHTLQDFLVAVLLLARPVVERMQQMQQQPPHP